MTSPFNKNNARLSFYRFVLFTLLKFVLFDIVTTPNTRSDPGVSLQ